MRRKGVLVVLEGIDGAGKTTVARWLIDRFRENGLKALYTYEPWESLFVKALRSEYNGVRDAVLDALVYAADRIIHLRKEVLPALEEGYVVVMDRYYYSSMAYQGAMGVSREWVKEINRYAIEPDIAIYIDVDPEIGISRLTGGGRRFPEYEKLELLRRVRSIYLEMVREGLLRMVDGNRGIGDVEKDVACLLSRLFPFFTCG